MKDKYDEPIEPNGPYWTITRREFLKGSSLFVAGLSSGASLALADTTDSKAKLSFGIVTDAHYADQNPRGARRYRESIAKMTECVTLMNDKKVDFLVELGDFKDCGKPVVEAAALKFLSAIEEVYGQFKGPRYHVLGNHDCDGVSKEQFLARVENTGIQKGSSYYSFDSKGVHFVVLDACFDAKGIDYDHGKFNWTDTNIPPKELAWLKKDLASSSGPVIAFVHQRLDLTDSTPKGHRCVHVKNGPEIQQVLQDSKRALAVFQGHHHAGHYSHIKGIHYYTLKAMVEGPGEKNNSYAIVDVHPDKSIVVTGYRKALSKEMKKA